MGKCFGCGKKLGMFEGYEASGKEFCKSCFPKRKEFLKEAKIKEETAKEYNERIEKEEKIEKKEDKEKKRIEKLKNPNEKELLFQIRGLLKYIAIILLLLLLYFWWR